VHKEIKPYFCSVERLRRIVMLIQNIVGICEMCMFACVRDKKG
jgi:hypothetical protein